MNRLKIYNTIQPLAYVWIPGEYYSQRWGPHWKPYRWEALGVFVPLDTEGSFPAYLGRDKRTGQIVAILQMWEQRVYRAGSELYAQRIWRPGISDAHTCFVGGLQGSGRGKVEDTTVIQRGFRLIRQVELDNRNQRGQKRLEDNPDSPYYHYIEQIISLKKKGYKNPAVALRLGLSEATLQKYLGIYYRQQRGERRTISLT